MTISRSGTFKAVQGDLFGSTLLYPVSLLIGGWDYQEIINLVGQLKTTSLASLCQHLRRSRWGELCNKCVSVDACLLNSIVFSVFLFQFWGPKNGKRCAWIVSSVSCFRLHWYVVAIQSESCDTMALGSVRMSNVGLLNLQWRRRDAKSNLNSTDAKFTPQKLAPNLLFFNKQPSGWFVLANVMTHWARWTQVITIGNKFDGRCISAHIYYSLLTNGQEHSRKSHSYRFLWYINSIIREISFAK